MKSGILAIIIFLLLSLSASLYLLARTTVFFGQAQVSQPTSIDSLANSYLFASPLQAKADSQELVRITVFLLDSRGLGIPNQNVSLNLPTTINSHPIQPITDDSGKAVFDLSSTIIGKYSISAQVQGLTIPQTVSVVFY